MKIEEKTTWRLFPEPDEEDDSQVFILIIIFGILVILLTILYIIPWVENFIIYMEFMLLPLETRQLISIVLACIILVVSIIIGFLGVYLNRP
jgi:hypothetical protein